MHDWLQDVWYDDAPSGVALRPLSWLFGHLVALRHWLYRCGLLRSHDAGRPVVVVGNLTVGGSGKTPLTLWLVERLRERGVKVGIVLRGYGRGERRPRLVNAADAYQDVGDEALLLARRGGCPVAVGADRVAAARLLAGQDVDLIVADDGLQHLALKRDFEIVVIDGARRFGNARLLPAGPLREPVTRLGSVDAVVVNGASGRAGEMTMTLRLGAARPVRREAGRGDATSRPLSDFTGRPVHAVAGIGYPQRFFSALADGGLEVIAHPFPDHHPFSPGDLAFSEPSGPGGALPVLMTEKDAVKCERFATARHWYVSVEARLDAGRGGWLVESVLALLAAPRRG
jgi:tetraacyldisaccharide 4'-kinase